MEGANHISSNFSGPSNGPGDVPSSGGSERLAGMVISTVDMTTQPNCEMEKMERMEEGMSAHVEGNPESRLGKWYLSHAGSLTTFGDANSGKCCVTCRRGFMSMRVYGVRHAALQSGSRDELHAQVLGLWSGFMVFLRQTLLLIISSSHSVSQFARHYSVLAKRVSPILSERISPLTVFSMVISSINELSAELMKACVKCVELWNVNLEYE